MCRRRRPRTRTATITRTIITTTITAFLTTTAMTITGIATITTAATITAMGPPPLAITAMTADAEASPLPLMLWLSPAFPVGAFAYSHGLEWAVEAGDIHDARSLGGWLADLLTFGAPRADAILFAAAFRAAEAGDWPALCETNALAVALAPSAERRLETTAHGAAFVA